MQDRLVCRRCHAGRGIRLLRRPGRAPSLRGRPRGRRCARSSTSSASIASRPRLQGIVTSAFCAFSTCAFALARSSKAPSPIESGSHRSTPRAARRCGRCNRSAATGAWLRQSTAHARSASARPAGRAPRRMPPLSREPALVLVGRDEVGHEVLVAGEREPAVHLVVDRVRVELGEGGRIRVTLGESAHELSVLSECHFSVLRCACALVEHIRPVENRPRRSGAAGGFEQRYPLIRPDDAAPSRKRPALLPESCGITVCETVAPWTSRRPNPYTCIQPQSPALKFNSAMQTRSPSRSLWWQSAPRGTLGCRGDKRDGCARTLAPARRPILFPHRRTRTAPACTSAPGA